MAIKIAKAGFFGGNPEAVLNAPVDLVLQVANFEKEQLKYIECYDSINQED